MPSSLRDKDATRPRSLGRYARERGWSKARAVYEFQQGLPFRTVPPLPPGCSIDWHNPNVTHGLNVETGDLTLILGVFGGPGVGFDTIVVTIEILPPTDAAAVSSTPTRGWWKPPPAETLKTAMEDIANGYAPGVRPTFNEVHKALEQRLGRRMPWRAARAALEKWAPQLARGPGEKGKTKSTK